MAAAGVGGFEAEALFFCLTKYDVPERNYKLSSVTIAPLSRMRHPLRQPCSPPRQLFLIRRKISPHPLPQAQEWTECIKLSARTKGSLA